MCYTLSCSYGKKNPASALFAIKIRLWADLEIANPVQRYCHCSLFGFTLP